MVGTGRFELPTPRTPSECSTRLSHVPTRKESAALLSRRIGFTGEFYHQRGGYAQSVICGLIQHEGREEL
jgi:hypothetical protein